MPISKDPATAQMIEQLQDIEQAMAILDQHARESLACAAAYKLLKIERDKAQDQWNAELNPGEERIYRCSEADKPYHADDDCKVWSTSEVCEKHVARYEKQMAAREAL